MAGGFFFEPLWNKQIGDSVKLSETDVQHQRDGFCDTRDEAARVVRIDEEDHDAVVAQRLADVRKWTVGYENVDRNLATRLGVDTPVGLMNCEGETEIDKIAEDVRTLWTDVDGQQERHEEWRDVVQESYVERYLDCPLEGPDAVMHLLERMLRFGGSPRGWCGVENTT